MSGPVGVPRGDREQARWVARHLLDELGRGDCQHCGGADPQAEHAARRRAQLEAMGLRWLEPVPDVPEGDLLRVVEAARVLQVEASRVYQWRTRGPENGGVRAYPGGVSLRECRALLARQDQRRGDGPTRVRQERAAS